MVPELPSADPAPVDGSLPEQALAGVGTRPFGVYLHVPFCTSRCGYCDFNTYTAAELRDPDGAPGSERDGYVAAAIAEIELAGRVLGDRVPEVATIFVGGGTPTVLPVAQLRDLIGAVRSQWPLAADVEVTTEANPESVDAAVLDQLLAAGFTRISFGMQSAVPHVLATLDRVHSAGRAGRLVAQAQRAGFAHTSVDLIYGTPGESLADWRLSVEAALVAGPDHISAYALVVEPGTRMAVRVRRGELPAPDPDDLADKYLLAEDLFGAAGFRAYEVSNWATSPAARCRHNLGYWRGSDWWGIGPGAHSHVGGVRWWNVKHPARYAARLAAGTSPAQGREVLTRADRQLEQVMLGIRVADGLDPAVLTPRARARLPELQGRGLLRPELDRVRLTVTGRLLADAVIRDLLD